MILKVDFEEPKMYLKNRIHFPVFIYGWDLVTILNGIVFKAWIFLKMRSVLRTLMRQSYNRTQWNSDHMAERKSSRRKKVERPQPALDNPIAENQSTAAVVEEKRQVYPASTVSIHWDALNTKRKISGDLRTEIADLYYDIQKKPEGNIPRLLELAEEYSDVQIFQAYLMTAYHLEDMDQKVLEVAEPLRKKYPDYMFGKIAFIETALIKGELDSIPKFLDNKYSYTELFPQKGVFHIFEVIYYLYSIGRYFALKGDAETATRYMDQIKFVDDEHVFIKRLQKAIDKGSGLKFYQKVIRKFKSSS